MCVCVCLTFVRLVYFSSSVLTVKKIWNDGLITAQAGRISWNNRLVTAWLNRQWIVHPQDVGVGWLQRSGHDPSWLLLLYSLSLLGSALSKNRACICHQSGKGMQIHVCLRPTDSCKLHNNRLYCSCRSHNSVCYSQMCVCIEYLWTLNGPLADCGYLRTWLCIRGACAGVGEASVVSLYLLCA